MAEGLTTGEVAAHFAEIYGASVSKDTISKITDKVVEERNEWLGRPLDRVYPVIFIDAIMVKIRVLSLILWWSVFVDHSFAEEFEAGPAKHLSLQHL